MSTNTNPTSISTSVGPWEQPWPAGELEELGSCPICANEKRERLYGPASAMNMVRDSKMPAF